MKKIIFAVTNDLSYDQRMIRICTSMAAGGYQVTLVGRKLPSSIPLVHQTFYQKRLRCFFHSGKLFYAEYNFRLFLYLLTRKIDCICAIDLDTAIPCYLVSALKKITRVYDAHELFCEMKEIVTRPGIYRIWKRIEQFTVPKFANGYTVNRPIAAEFHKMYGVQYEVVRSITVLKEVPVPAREHKFILYQGSVNEGRSFETLIPAMKQVNGQLLVIGDGNFMKQSRLLVEELNLKEKVIFKGKLSPDELYHYTLNASIGITIFENNGLSNYLSLANRFFDYMHAAVPQVCSAYPAYQEINNLYEVAVLLEDLSPENIALHCNRLLNDTTLYRRLQANCMRAREVYNWQNEELKLINFYNRLSM